MQKHDSNTGINFLSTGLNLNNLPRLKKFYAYYLTHTLAKSCKKFHFPMKRGTEWVLRIEKQKSLNLLIKRYKRNFSVEQKLEVIKFSRRHGVYNATHKYGISPGVQLRWIQQYKNNQLQFDPDKKWMSMLTNNLPLRYDPLWLNKNDLIKAIEIEDRVYGGTEIWASTKMRYRAIDIMKKRRLLPVDTLCRLARVSPSGYFSWKINKQQFNSWNDEIAQKIIAVNKTNDYFGIRRIANKINDKHIGVKKIYRYLNDMQIKTRQRGRNIHGIPKNTSKIKNYLFKKGRPWFDVPYKNYAWAFDYSLICEDNGQKIYILLILDLYGRYILDYSFMTASQMQPVLVDRMERLFKKEKPLYAHSDQGIQMVSTEYRHLLDIYKVKQSMNHISGKPRLNACLESIYSTLKVEINLKKLVKTKTPQQIKTIISKWIRFYNTDRHHSKLNTTPKAYRNGTPL